MSSPTAEESFWRALWRRSPARFEAPLTVAAREQVSVRLLDALGLFALGWLVALLLCLLGGGDAAVTRHLGALFWVEPQHERLKALTDGGLYPFYVFFIGLLVVGWRRRNRLYFEVARLWIAAELLGALLVVRALKMVVGHPRPDAAAEPAARLFGLAWDSAYNSFPSGHSADVFTSAFCLCLLLSQRWQRAYVLGFAALIGLTRILLAKHWASDVLVGAAIGVVVSALLAARLLRNP